MYRLIFPLPVFLTSGINQTLFSQALEIYYIKFNKRKMKLAHYW